MSKEESLSIANPHPENTSLMEKVALSISGIGVLILFLAFFGIDLNKPLFLGLSMLAFVLGTAIFTYAKYNNKPAGIKNNGIWFDSLSNRGLWAWIIGIVLTGFYVLLYFFPEWLGKGTGAEGANEGVIGLFDPLSKFLNGNQASEWFIYGTLYTVSILLLGTKFIVKYWHNRYQKVRTIVVMISQFFLAYFIPEILVALNYNGVQDDNLGYEVWYDADLKNIWPLNYDFFYDWNLAAMQSEATQPIGMTFLVVGILLAFIGMPIITYFVGKRWYCSWVCGCGGLAETAGDSFRHLSDKSVETWKIERVLIHAIILIVTLMTALVLADYFNWFKFDFKLNFIWIALILLSLFALILWKQRKRIKESRAKKTVLISSLVLLFALGYFYFIADQSALYINTGSIKTWYGFLIGATFSGIIGVGFYPLLGNRVWCRFGCPLAGYMGLIQRFKSRFRITTNGGQCISCGNCSTYCEQGIDVRWYAQRGQNIVRASCVGCGVCSAVCPRGVLKLENGPEKGRFKDDHPIIIGNNGIELRSTN